MVMTKKILAMVLCLLLLSGCGNGTEPTQSVPTAPNSTTTATTPADAVTDLGDDSKTFGEAIEATGAYDGYFEGDSMAVVVEWVSGTANAYRLEGNTLRFTALAEDSVYRISGTFRGNIVIDVGDDYKFDLELQGFSLVCNSVNPITVLSGDEVSLKAKKDTKNYLYDMRPAVDPADESQYAGAIHSVVDLELSGKGELFVVSENNNGIHSKDDLQVKNLTLLVACLDNALKGNDSVQITEGCTTLIASEGDGIKTSNSDISEKGNQRGNITIAGGTHTIYAACDGLDAAYDVQIDEAATVVNIFTDKYSNYSREVTATASDTNYIRFTSNAYYYSVKYYNSETDYVWVNAQYHSQVSGGRTNYYYYAYPKMPEYAKQQFFIYDSADKQGQETDYLVMSDYLTPNPGSDTFALTSSQSGLYYEWTNYTTKIQTGGFGGFGGPGGFGGMGDGNTDKGDHSTKGIKAANEIRITDGSINIKSYDDAIHAGDDNTLENGAAPLGNVTIEGGVLTLYSNDDGIHADGVLTVQSGSVSVTNAYEGLEGAQVQIAGGAISIYSKDDGINATTTTGTAITISGGEVYIYCTGDGIDSNSRSANVGIVFSGGHTVVISNSGMNSAIDSENGYTYTAGAVVAVMPRGGMSGEATHCSNFSQIGKSIQLSLTQDQYLLAQMPACEATIRMPVTLSAVVIVLGSKDAAVQTAATTALALDGNGVCWQNK